jgi:hypothetical protein
MVNITNGLNSNRLPVGVPEPRDALHLLDVLVDGCTLFGCEPAFAEAARVLHRSHPWANLKQFVHRLLALQLVMIVTSSEKLDLQEPRTSIESKATQPSSSVVKEPLRILSLCASVSFVLDLSYGKVVGFPACLHRLNLIMTNLHSK